MIACNEDSIQEGILYFIVHQRSIIASQEEPSVPY